tara:strand:- start:74 stop:1399 length:1326 start_codon:yes stop_codon:yes gene_type:complete
MPAIQSEAPHIPGISDLKGGDIVHVLCSLDTQGEDIDTIEISVKDSGISDGSQVVFTNSYTSSNDPGMVTDMGGDLYNILIPIRVTRTRTGAQSISLLSRNKHGTLSDEATSTDDIPNFGAGQVVVDHIGPTFLLTKIDYPAGQLALGMNDAATLTIATNNLDTILYESIDGDLNITSPSVDLNLKTVTCTDPSRYNIIDDNIKASLLKSTNGMTLEDTLLVQIASSPINFSIDIPNGLLSSNLGEVYPFVLESDQKMLNNPSIQLPNTQNPQSILTQIQAGTNELDNEFELLIKDGDLKGSFGFIVNGKNLADIDTTTSNVSSYNVSGFAERTVEVHPHSILQGLGHIGTTVTNPQNVKLENLSEAGTGLNGGTSYTYIGQALTLAPKVSIEMDFNNGFTTCSGDGTIANTGTYFFNLDALSRAANADTSTPAHYLIKED